MKRLLIVLCLLAGVAQGRTVAERMRSILLPDRVFRDVPVVEILETVGADSVGADPEGVGVSLIVLDNAAGTLADQRITITLRGLTVERALRLLAAAAELHLRVDANAVVVTPSTHVIRPSS